MTISHDSTLQRTFSAMEYLGREKRKVALSELAADLSMTPAAARRILNGLIHQGYAERDDAGRYFLTYKVYRVAGKSLNRENFLDDMIPYMNYFAMRYGYEVGLTVFDGDSVIHVMNVGKSVTLGKSSLRPGQVFPLYCSAPGKVLLARMEPQALERWLEENTLLPQTAQTIIDKERLRQEVERTRTRGYGVSEGELYDIVYAVAFPIHNPTGDIIGTFNFRMLPEIYQENMCTSFPTDVLKTLKNFGV